MHIRDAQPEDLPEVIQMGRALQDDSRQYEPDLVYDEDAAMQRYQAEIDNPNARILVACDDDNEAILGYQYSYKTRLDYLEDEDVECVLEAVYVYPEHRGKGVGAALAYTAQRLAIEEWRARRFKATIYAGSVASIALHRRLGFQPHATEFVKHVD